jgi:hypothetical protein
MKTAEIEMKYADSLDWKAKSAKLDYTMSLLEKYRELKTQGWSDKRILKLIPDMKEVMDANNAESDSD